VCVCVCVPLCGSCVCGCCEIRSAAAAARYHGRQGVEIDGGDELLETSFVGTSAEIYVFRCT